VDTETESTPIHQCSTYLRSLLTGRYGPVWRQHAERFRGSGINYSAVSKVLSRHLEREYIDGVHHRELRDRVRRALTGEVLTLSTIDLFVNAFRLNADEADNLRRPLLHPAPEPDDERSAALPKQRSSMYPDAERGPGGHRPDIA
jgi:hypothetical protein